jgi:hypothetical protein
MPSDVVWEGKIGSTPLRVEVAHAERIVAEWESAGGRRQKVSSSADEFEKTVLFQIMLSSGAKSEDVQEVREKVTMAQAERPAPVREAPVRRKKPRPQHHRRSRTRSRRR